MEIHEKDIPSKGKVNAALTTGIIGTALGGLNMLGGNLGSLVGNNKNVSSTTCSGVTDSDLYIEREQCKNYIELTKQYYNQQLEMQAGLNSAFNNLKQYNIDNSFALYKYSRDSHDALNEKINCIASKVDVMNAIRPYQDALINSKIDQNALIADFNLSRRTCRMISGELVLPSTPTVTGYASYSPCNCNAAPAQ
jgi:hypothetical protein